jgi:hypothetical protein
MRSPYVVIGFHDFGMVTGKFAYCLSRAVAYEGNRIKSVVRWPGPYTDEARNKIVETFLAFPEQVEYLMMVDADIDFEKDAISKTMWIAQNTKADVVWGNYALGTFSNSLFAKDPDGTEFAAPLDELKPNKVYENIYAGGTGWCLMRRPLLVKMKETFPGPWHWFERDVVTSPEGKIVKMGEDLSFGKRVASMEGTKQVGYTGNFLVHHKLHPTVPQFMGPVAEELGLTVNTQSVQG